MHVTLEPEGQWILPRITFSKRRIATLLGVVVLAYFGVCTYFWAVQVRKVLAPTAKIPTNPERMGMKYESEKIPVRTGDQTALLDAFWVPAKDSSAPAFLYLHGQDATIGKNLEHTRRLYELGYSVLVVDYLGYGKTHGQLMPNEESVYRDAQAAWDHLTGTLGYDAGRIFIFGHSLGGAVAIELASHHEETAGLIVEGTFTSILDMSKLRYFGTLRLLPIDYLLHQRFDSLAKIGTLKVPVLLIHGTDDVKVPCTMAHRLFAAAVEPKQLLLVDGAGHTDCGSIGWVEYREKLTRFVEKYANAVETTAE
jgi:fermentation-respiration switch protein FrsA (DUF1100 family)